MKRVLTIGLLAAVVSGCEAQSPLAPEPTSTSTVPATTQVTGFTFHGKVTTSLGIPISDVRVVLRSVEGFIVGDSSSDTNGEFWISGVPQGTMQLEITKDSFSTTQSVDINGDTEWSTMLATL
jgi:hypothetical protein